MGQRLHVKYDAANPHDGGIADAVADTGMRAWLEHEEPVAGSDRAPNSSGARCLGGVGCRARRRRWSLEAFGIAPVRERRLYRRPPSSPA